MILPILQYGDQTLRTKGNRIEEIDDRIRELAANMIETMHAAHGVGLAAQQIRAAFPRARVLHETAKTVGSTTEELIRGAGFDIIHVPSNTLPNHYRIIHPEGAAGFRDENLAHLAGVFVNMTGH